jgi:uncharacterized membrane protein (UPF0182 family)
VPAASSDRFQTVDTSRLKRLGIRLLVVVLVVYALWLAFRAFVTIRTSVLWYRSVHVESVYSTALGAQILLFVVFGGLTALAVAGALVAVSRLRPRFRPDPEKQKWRHRFLQVEPRLRIWLILVVSLWLGIRVGSAAASRWQTYLLWRHAVPWHQQDAQFHRDLSYFVDVFPFHRMVVSTLSSIVVTALVVTLVASYLYGALRIRGRGPRMTTAFKAQMSLLIGLWLLLRGAGYWLGRFALTTSNHGPVTGLSYTDAHALLPARTVLMVVAVLCALLLFANIWLRRLRYAVIGLAVMFGASLLIGSLWPSLVSRYREQPSASSLDRTTIERNQAATLAAFGLDHQVSTQTYGTGPTLRGSALAAQARRTAQVRLLDPNQLSPTFNFKQQNEAYYGFKSTLDIDHYPLGGADRDLAVAVRELNLSGIPRSTWTNNHMVYTHGYGVVAAPTDQLSSKTGTPIFVNGGLPPKNKIPVTTPQIYFGQNSPSYSIVGQPKGSTKNLEFDYPSNSGSTKTAHTTYAGGGGVPIGSRLDRLLYAVKLHDPNIFFSSEINGSSKLLTVRNPRTRVAQVAPWLTLDGDVYPAMVGGHVDWVVDGYTASSNYPASQQVNLRSATTNSLTRTGSTVVQPNRSVNYLRNSVKAVVDAYTGRVTLYSWNQAQDPDPVLQTWEQAFPGLVQPESAIPADLLPHLRYPQDLFNVQRSLLTNYHVTDPADFYNGSDFWRVPNDPTVAATFNLNSHNKSGSSSSPTMPSVFMSMSPTGYGAAAYTLSTPMVTLNYRDLAGFLTVNAQPGPDYGKFTMLEFPAGQSVESPAQIQNDIESDNTISKALTLQRGGNSKVVLGNLLTIPLGGKILYVEPVYTQAQGSNSFPILRHVIAVYGNGQPAFKSTLDAAVTEAIANDEASSR